MPSPTQKWGFENEAKVEKVLSLAGFRVVERNWEGAGAEIDRIAYDGDVLVFIEIRSRRSSAQGDPAETVRFPKRGRVARAALAYLAGLPSPLPECRFDVVSVLEREAGGVRIRLFRGAFDASVLSSRRSGPMI